MTQVVMFIALYVVATGLFLLGMRAISRTLLALLSAVERAVEHAVSTAPSERRSRARVPVA